MQKGKIVILSGPSGVGKNTILEMLVKQLSNAIKINTATTRAPRANEVDGIDHYFLTKEQFEQKMQSGEVLEHNTYNDNYYGTLKKPLSDAINSGKVGVMEIDVNGAMAIKKLMPEVVTVFINAESLERIEQRLRERKTDTEEAIQNRLKTAQAEINVSREYDHVVINPEGHPEKAVAEIEKLVLN